MVGGRWVKSYLRTRIPRLVPSMRRLTHLSLVSFLFCLLICISFHFNLSSSQEEGITEHMIEVMWTSSERHDKLEELDHCGTCVEAVVIRLECLTEKERKKELIHRWTK